MRKFKTFLFLSFILFSISVSAQKEYPKSTGEYKLVVEGFDWGPAVNKVIIALDDTTSHINSSDFSVYVTRKSSDTEISADQSSGQRSIYTLIYLMKMLANLKLGVISHWYLQLVRICPSVLRFNIPGSKEISG